MNVPGDHPIESPEDDLLGRRPMAERFAEEVLSLDASKGLVVGVLGAWGSGKTSFLNMARRRFGKQQILTIAFNPWMFSGAEQLVDSFFTEVAAQLRGGKGKKLSKIADGLEGYGAAVAGLAWLPGFGSWLERSRLLAKTAGKALKRGREQSATQRRADLSQQLADLDRPIVVVLDDIDRLTPVEIRHVFQLVRLTASFPNLIYVVAFDRERVEKALDDAKFSGRDYLEKILFLTIDVPPIPDQVLITQVTTAVDAAINDIEDQGPWHENTWPDILMEVVRPLLNNMRDVRRYSAAVAMTVRALEGRVALADVLGLEAVRVFRPDIFARLAVAADALTTTRDLSDGHSEDPGQQAAVHAVIQASEEDGDLGRDLVRRLFPAAERHVGGTSYTSSWASTWLRDRRVAHPDILRMYLERVPSEGLVAFDHAEEAFQVLADANAFDTLLRGVSSEVLERVISTLEAYESDYPPEAVVPAATVLLNMMPNMPKRERGMFELDTRFVVGRVVYRLLRSLPGPEDVLAAARAILPQLTTLSSEWDLITDVGHREGAGHKLVTEVAAAELESEFRQRVRAATPEQLLHEWDLLRILYSTHDVDGEAAVIPPDDAELTRAVLNACYTETRGQSLGSRAVTRSKRLQWEALVKVYGDEETLRSRIEAARALLAESDSDLLDLTDRYLSGWRPRNFGED